MKKITTIILLLLVLAFKQQSKQRIVFFGDSITQMDINTGGYIDRIKNYLDSSGK